MKKALPNQFKTSHEFAFFLHDLLADIVVEGEKAKVFDTSFTLHPQTDADAIAGLTGEDLWKWLENNGYSDVNLETTYKQLIAALIADFCRFVYETLQCSKKGKLAIAYTLLRKPLKDNLFYLEWLLADRGDFMQRFHNEGPEAISLSMSDAVSRQRRLDIIQLAINKTNSFEMISADFIYKLRYDKAMVRGFEPLWNKAAHLVTTSRHYTTERQNINFIFSGEDAHLDQWQHIYSLLPMLLYHTLEVAEALMRTITMQDEDIQAFREARKIVGLDLWLSYLSPDDKDNISTPSSDEILRLMELHCPNCQKPINFGKRNLRSFYLDSKAICGSCHAEIVFQ